MEGKKNPSPHKKVKIFFILSIVLILNLIWEFSHYRLYEDLTGIPKLYHIIAASFADMVIIAIILLIISLLNKNAEWLENPTKKDYFLIIFGSIIVAIIIEAYNLSIGRWEYNAQMPTILGIGLSPLLQLFVTSITSLGIAKWYNRYLYKRPIIPLYQ